MNKFLLSIASFAVVCLLNTTASAQSDSTHYDLGRVRLNKQFTQAVTVKGADLERSPFTNISDALNVWFYGINTNNNTTVYVVDGVLVNDVNAYSIYDIEEATLIQDASTQLNGAFQHKQLVLITTRRHLAEKAGVVVSAQANIVKKSHKYFDSANTNADDNFNSNTGVYQQYNLSAFKNMQTSHFGLSANYQHDVIPGIYNNTNGGKASSGDPQFGIGKFYVYADHTLFTGTVAGVRVNYATQKGDEEGVISNPGGAQQYAFAAKQQLFNAEAYVDSKIAGGFSNYLSFTYNSSVLDNTSDLIVNYSGTNEHGISVYHGTNRQYYLKDNFSYKATLGNFSIEPSLNFTYRRPVTEGTSDGYITNSGMKNLNTSRQDGNQLTLTPSADITYKNIVNIQGGFTQLLSTKANGVSDAIKAADKTLPFVTGSISSANFFSGFTITAYGSYSRSVPTLDVNSRLITTVAGYNSDPVTYYAPIYNTTYNSYTGKAYNSSSYGVKLALPNDILTLGYRYEKRDLEVPLTYMDVNETLFYVATAANYSSHRIELAAKLVQTNNVRWVSNLNTSHIYAAYAQGNPNNGYANDDKLWTGGWANRVDYNNVFVGADVLYMFSSTNNPGSLYSEEHINPFSLQNVFVGYTFKTLGFKSLQVYANARNIAHSVNSLITDDRYFYGAGIKAAF